jgi:hypothetical protein
MISLALTRGLADTRLTPIQRLTLAHLHGELNWSEYRPIKLANVRHGIHCTKGAAYKALVALERWGYIEAHPTEHGPRHFRLVNPDSLHVETRRAA